MRNDAVKQDTSVLTTGINESVKEKNRNVESRRGQLLSAANGRGPQALVARAARSQLGRHHAVPESALLQGDRQHGQPWFESTGGQELPSSSHMCSHARAHLSTAGHTDVQCRSVGWSREAGEHGHELCCCLCKIDVKEVDKMGNRMQADISNTTRVSVCGFRSSAVFNYCKPFPL